MKKEKRPWWSIPPSPPPEGFPDDVLWLSPAEEAILYACSEVHFRSAREIRQGADLPSNRRRNFIHLLRNLVERLILETDTQERYRIRTRKRARRRKSA